MFLFEDEDWTERWSGTSATQVVRASTFLQSTSCRVLNFSTTKPSWAPLMSPAPWAYLTIQGTYQIECPRSCQVFPLYTGNSAFLRPPPALSKASCMYGPTTGTFPANPPTVEKKSPKSTMIPYNSIKKPTNGHRRNMRIIPAVNAAVPFNFWYRAKKTAVFCIPIMNIRPRRNKTCSGDINQSLSEKGHLLHCPWPACVM